MYAAKKYIMPHVVRACVQYLERNIDAGNACLLLSHSRLFDEPELIQRCLDVIDSQAGEAFQSDSFTEIDYKTLEQILGREYLRVEEKVVYAAATRWAEAECLRQGRDASPQQCREVLGDALYLIRFPTMTLDDFSKGAAQSDLLRKQDVIDLLLYLTTDEKPTLRFPTHYRKGRMQQFMKVSRFKEAKGYPWDYADGRDNCINFKVDKSVFVVGFGLYGCRESAVEYHVEIQLMLDRKLLRRKEKTIVSDGSPTPVHVLFDSAVEIKANEEYTAILCLKNDKPGYSGSHGINWVRCADVKFEFLYNPRGENFTHVLAGQIPEILFFCQDWSN